MVSGSTKMDLTGQVYNRLKVRKFAGYGKSNKVMWECSCECGSIVLVSANSLRNGNTKSCGCLRRDLGKDSKSSVTHGLSRSKQYLSWVNMRTRCNYVKDRCYDDYGGRGISYDPKWEKFECFWEEMQSDYVDGYTLERKDPNENYSRSNCIWIPRGDQGRNKRKLKVNKSGVTGVSYGKGGYWLASWYEDGKQKVKSFSIKIYGDELSFFLACEYRDQMINLLKLKGVYYGELHGK